MAHTTAPDNLPIPIDDGACDHLLSLHLPSITLPSTSTNPINLSTLPSLTILFCYPRTGAPSETIPDTWNAIPGARGCTPQACSYRDAYSQLSSLGVSNVFGLSTQDTAYQMEVRTRLELPYELLSDETLEFVGDLGLPTFEWEGKKLVKRMTLAIEDGKVIMVHYPDFPSGKSAEFVVEWLKKKYKK